MQELFLGKEEESLLEGVLIRVFLLEGVLIEGVLIGRCPH